MPLQGKFAHNVGVGAHNVGTNNVGINDEGTDNVGTDDVGTDQTASQSSGGEIEEIFHLVEGGGGVIVEPDSEAAFQLTHQLDAGERIHPKVR